MTTGRILSIAFGALGLILLAGAALVPLIAHPGVEAAGRALFRLTCHGIPERSLTIAGEPMAICARCTGIWAGLLTGSLLFGIGALRRPVITPRVMFLVALPLIIDGVSQATGLRESTNLLRLMTGFPTGLVGILWALQYATMKRAGKTPYAEAS